jgi:hypothetical protein
MVKQSLAWMLVLTILINSGFMALYTISEIALNRRSIEKHLYDEIKSAGRFDLLISFSANDLKNAKWEHEKEFFLNGKKYDVMERVESNGQVQYTCIHDKKEQSLIKELEKDHKKNRRIAYNQSIFAGTFPVYDAFVFPFALNSYSNYWNQNYEFAYIGFNFHPPPFRA